MKYFIIFCLLFSGCATVSEYNQGCRDGVSELTKLFFDKRPSSLEDKNVELFCNNVEYRKQEKEVQGRGRR